MIEFQIEDTGQGIDEEHQLQMFQLFGKVKNKDDYNSTGVGLGLTYCKNVIQHMNGEIFCESKVGMGAKFIFYIQAQCY